MGDAKVHAAEWRLLGIAGLLARRKNRLTKSIISLYRSNDAGLETDPDLPYTTLCETHGNLVSHETRRAAVIAMTSPDWCAECQALLPESPSVVQK